MYGACISIEENLVLSLMVFTGLMVSEFIHMRRSWLDVREGIIRVPVSQPCSCRACAGRGGVWRPKTGSGNRAVPIVPEVEACIIDYFAANDDIITLVPYRELAWRIVRTIGQRCHLKSFPHALRATFATLAAGSVPEELVIAHVMGWKNLDMARHYIKMAGTKVRESFAKGWKRGAA
jgi:integrase